MNHLQSLNRDTQHGFTLVELLIVVIILAILAAIVVPQFSAATDDAKLSALDTNLANMRSSIDLYYQQHGKYPGDVTSIGTALCGWSRGHHRHRRGRSRSRVSRPHGVLHRHQ